MCSGCGGEFICVLLCGERILCFLVVVNVYCVFLLWWVYFVCSCCGECILCVILVVSLFFALIVVSLIMCCCVGGFI